jgi:O-antigen ligase
MMAARLDRAELAWLAGLAGLAALVGLLAGLDPRLAIGASLGIGFVLVVFADLALGFALFALVSFLEVLPLAGGGLSVAKLSGGLVALAWLAVIATRPDSRQDFLGAHSWASALLGLFLGWVVLSAAWAEAPPEALSAAGRFAPNLLLFLIAYTAIRTRRHALALTIAFVIGSVATAAYGFTTTASAGDYAGRLTGSSLDPNELAAALVAAVALSGALAANARRSPGLRLAAYAAGGFCLLGVFMTVSRGGLLALVVGLAAALLFSGRWRLKVSVGALLVALGAFYYFAQLAPPEARDRILDSPRGETRLLEGRTTIWEVGWRMADDNLATGVGAGNFPVSSRHYVLEPGTLNRTDQILIENPEVAHNTYLGILAELGVVGLALFLAIVAFSFGCSVRAARAFRARGDPGGEALARALTVALAAVLTADFFISEEYSKQLWLLLGFAPALLAISRAPAGDER